jgi:hypothetical protein
LSLSISGLYFRIVRIAVILTQREDFMKHHRLFYLFFLIILVLPGCVNQYTRWAQQTFNQGCDLEHPCISPFLKTVTIYDQFQTVGIFDALWLSRPVRRAYVELVVDKFGKSDREYHTLMQSELKKNNEVISFYLLVEKEYSIRGMQALSLDQSATQWGVSLEIDDTVLHPIAIEKVDLSPEYRTLFGERLRDYKNRLKQAYFVSFEASGVPGQPFIHSGIDTMRLVLSTTKKQICLEWDNPHGLEGVC